MKVTEKIVTSVTQPQLTNVMWHNPDTGEFKIFGGKGWEPAGGKMSDSNTTDNANNSAQGNYPIKMYKPNVGLLPNTYYIANEIIKEDICLCPTGPNIEKIKMCIMKYIDKVYPSLVPIKDIELMMPGYIEVPLDATNDYYLLSEDAIVQNLIMALSAGYTTYVKIINTTGECGYALIVDLYGELLPLFSLSPISNGSVMTDGTSVVKLLLTSELLLVEKGDVYTHPLFMMPCCDKALKFENITPIMIGDDTFNYKVMFSNPMVSAMFHMYEEQGIQLLATDCKEGAIVGTIRNTADGPCVFLHTVIHNLNVSLKPDTLAVHYILDGTFDKIELNMPVYWENDTPPECRTDKRHVISILEGVGCYTTIPVQLDSETT